MSVSGDGSVGLKQVSDETNVELVRQPEVAEFSPVEEAERDAAKVGVGDVVRHLFAD